jgi:hypothetical protein
MMLSGTVLKKFSKRCIPITIPITITATITDLPSKKTDLPIVLKIKFHSSD